MANKVSPIKPSEVAKGKRAVFPDAVFEAFNELISRNFSEGSAEFDQGDVVALMVEKGLDKDEIFVKGWLNIEEAYEAAGWKVKYDKPAYDENYPVSFTFTPKHRR